MTPSSDVLRLRDYLSELGWSQRYFAKRISRNPRTINRWIKGSDPVDPLALEYLGVMVRLNRLLYPPGAGKPRGRQ